MVYNNIQQAIINTILYSDIFDFPLSEIELRRSLITDQVIDKSCLITNLNILTGRGVITYKNGFYCLKGRKKIINQRRNRISMVTTKLKIARDAARYLSYIPTIYFIGLSGRLCHMDAGTDDDIDFFIITKKNTIWTTRLMALAVLEFLNLRRKQNDFKPKNKICLNLIIDETALAWPVEKHDLYIAHEISHLIPLFVRNDIYNKFLNNNNWIDKFYINRAKNSDVELYTAPPRKYFTLNAISSILSLPPLEYIWDKFQRIYMKVKITNEIILPNFLAFHPHDYRKETLEIYNTKVKKVANGTI